MAAIRGEFSTESVGRALREQWSDDDLAKRDKAKCAQAMFADNLEEELDGIMGGEEDEAFTADEMDEDLREAYMVEQSRIESAMAAIQAQKTTLKDAKWKQKQLKLSRGFYPPKPFQKSQNSFKKVTSSEKRCFRCNGPHLIADCPVKQQEARVSEEAAQIAFSAWQESEQAGLLGEECMEAVSTEKAVESCMGIIDSGATSSLGSAEALERIMLQNLESTGDSKMQINVHKRPTFKFGNGQKKDCLSTVSVEVGAGDKQGLMEIHVHDTPGQPVLISRKALKSLGAVIDFGEGLAIYKQVDGRKVVRLNEADNGHLLMPITGNILSGAQERKTTFVSLCDEYALLTAWTEKILVKGAAV